MINEHSFLPDWVEHTQALPQDQILNFMPFCDLWLFLPTKEAGSFCCHGRRTLVALVGSPDLLTAGNGLIVPVTPVKAFTVMIVKFADMLDEEWHAGRRLMIPPQGSQLGCSHRPFFWQSSSRWSHITLLDGYLQDSMR
jgi:hypothetical protein